MYTFELSCIASKLFYQRECEQQTNKRDVSQIQRNSTIGRRLIDLEFQGVLFDKVIILNNQIMWANPLILIIHNIKAQNPGYFICYIVVPDVQVRGDRDYLVVGEVDVGRVHGIKHADRIVLFSLLQIELNNSLWFSLKLDNLVQNVNWRLQKITYFYLVLAGIDWLMINIRAIYILLIGSDYFCTLKIIRELKRVNLVCDFNNYLQRVRRCAQYFCVLIRSINSHVSQIIIWDIPHKVLVCTRDIIYSDSFLKY